MSGVKPFTGIRYYTGKLDSAKERDILYNKFFYKHPMCTSVEICNKEAIAYYTDPIYPAILLKNSTKYFGNMCLLSFDHKSKKLHPRVLTIRNINKSLENKIQEIISQTKALLLKETKTKIIIKLPSFLKATQVSRKLKKMKINTKFTSKKVFKKLVNEL